MAIGSAIVMRSQALSPIANAERFKFPTLDIVTIWATASYQTDRRDVMLGKKIG